MTKVKIETDPYKKEISYWRWGGDNWVKVTPATNTSNKLVGREFSTGFFPFKVKKIIDELINAYYSGSEMIELTFAGTEDDYQELETVCNSEAYKDKIVCRQDEVYLNNARDIINEVSGIFGGLRELIEGSVEDRNLVQADLNRYSEAASEMIPICVFGNVSSGKSSFINALIGNEVLPSGDEPITSKVYKITKSENQNRAIINLSYDGQPIQILFNEHDRIQTNLLDNVLIEGLKKSLEDSKNQRVAVRVGAALAFINHYGVDESGCEEQERVSDLIEIEVPYDEDGILKDSSNKYILFDTPGSNAASNEKHKEVLMNSMKNLTNGLPVFVATSDTLDTEDNLKLYDELRKYEDLIDSRFTMIVVNKADKAKLPKKGLEKEQITDILRQAIPRKMYSFGIYYISSVMGLGAKVEDNGDFVDDNYARIYMTERANFSDEKGRFYTQLYKYDILPEQVRNKLEETVEMCPSVVYANSGMYCLERAIELFASNYSAYNKCQQSQRFLRRVLEQTRDKIDEAKVIREEHKENLNTQLEQSTAEIINDIEIQIGAMKNEFIDGQPKFMQKTILETNQSLTKIDLQFLEQTLTNKNRREKGYLDKKLEVEKASLSPWERFRGNRTDVPDLVSIDREIDMDVANELFDYVKANFTDAASSANSLLNLKSREYWQQNTTEMRNRLIRFIKQDFSIIEEKKNELSDVIASFPEVVMDGEADELFIREDYGKYLFVVGAIKLGDRYRLNLPKLKDTYNRKLKEYIGNADTQIREKHKEAFTNWCAKLIVDIIEHIQEMHPYLKGQVEEIEQDTGKIADLENRQARLAGYVGQIEDLMAWKNR